MATYKRILITGCGGMLGHAVFDRLSKTSYDLMATDINLIEPWLNYMDVANYKSCEMVFEKFRPDLVIHMAAIPDVEFCENNKEKAREVMVSGTTNISSLSQKYDSELVNISTSAIFDGEEGPFNEHADANPVSEYGRLKLEAEEILNSNHDQYYNLRPAWMIGGGPTKDKKFIAKIFSQLNAGKTELSVVDDKFGSITYTHDFAENLLYIIEGNHYSAYNITSDGVCSRFEMAEKFIDYLGLSEKVNLTKIKTADLQTEYFGKRPTNEVLNNSKLKSIPKNKIRNWEECLREYTNEFKKIIETRQI